MIFARHPGVVHCFVEQLEGHSLTPFLSAAAASVRVLRGTMGFDPPTWQSLCEGARPELLEPDDFEPGTERGGWQHEAASRVERQFREEVLCEQMTPQARAFVRSQSGPGGSMVLTTAPTSVLTKIPPHLFRVVLLRRLRLPLPLSQHAYRCGRPIDPFGHHRAACARTGALGRRGFALESGAARVCKEAGGRVTTNVMVRDLDLPVPNAADGRRLEVVVDGLPLFGGSQLAVDTTLVCALRSDGTPHRGAAEADGVVLSRARQRKEQRHPELVGPGSRARLVVLAVEVGGQMVCRDAHVCGSVGEGQGPAGTMSPAEEG